MRYFKNVKPKSCDSQAQLDVIMKELELITIIIKSQGKNADEAKRLKGEIWSKMKLYRLVVYGIGNLQLF